MSVPIAGIRQVVIWQKNKGQFPALILRDPLVLKHSSALMDYEGKQATNYEVEGCSIYNKKLPTKSKIQCASTPHE